MYRALKRRLSDLVYKQMVKDAKTGKTGPGGQRGAALQSSAADPIPEVSSSEQSLPGPADTHPRTPLLAAS
jgi:transposase